MDNDNWKYVLILILTVVFFFILGLDMYFESLGYNYHESRMKQAEIFWIMGILGYIGIRIYYFIKVRK